MMRANRLVIPRTRLRFRAHLLIAAALFAFASISSSLTAAVIVDDTWLDATDTDPASPVYSENGIDVDLDGDLESAWLQGGVGTLDPIGAGGPLHGDMTAQGTSSATWTTYFTPEGSEINLSNTGDTIRVTWVFTPRNINITTAGGEPGSNTSQNFRFALVDTVVGDGSTRAEANGSLPSAVFTGYGVWANMGTTLGNSNPFQLRERTSMTPDTLMNSTGDFNDVLGNGASADNDGYDGGTQYTMIWEATRNGGGLDLDVGITGGTLDGDGEARVTVTDPSANGGSFKFDTFGIRPSGATTTAEFFDTSLFRVEFIPIPEPASGLLVGLAATSLIVATRWR
ncbi:MAG TPA: hypothetical protein VGK58_15035 [Lacipirellulaceae bacterium]